FGSRTGASPTWKPASRTRPPSPDGAELVDVAHLMGDQESSSWCTRAKDRDRLSNSAAPFSTLPNDGRPMIPDDVYLRIPTVSRSGRSLASWSAVWYP